MQKSFLLFLAFLFSLTTHLSAQNTGSIKGRLIDSTANETVIGANIVIQGTTIGGSTDVDGNYTIQNLQAGTYNLVISCVGYKPKQIDGVKVYAGKITIVDTNLESDVAVLEAAVIVAQRETFSEVSVISEIRLAESVAVGISAEQISKSQDRDASQIVRRIPGINVSDNNFIRIRGLAERYNNVMLHNAFAPSVETDVKSFAFNLIPSSQIDRLLVYKSPAADLPGDFSGGMVKIFTKSIPTENSINLDYSVQYRVGTTFEKFRNQERGNAYFTGINTGYYDLPSGFPPDLRASSIADNPLALQQVGRSLKNLWEVEERTTSPDQRFGINANFRFDLGKIKVGNITSVTYSNSYTNFDIDRADYNIYDNEEGSQPIYNYTDSQYTQNIRLGILHNWAFRFNQNHTIELKNLFNQTSNGQYVDRVGPNFESFAFFNSGAYDQTYRGLYTGQLTGKHQIFNENTSIDWVVGYNNAFRDQPDYKRYRSDVVGINNQTELFVPTGNAQPNFLGRFFSEMNESSITGAVNFVQKLNFLNKDNKELTPEFRLGMFYENKDRDFKARNIGFVRSSTGNPDPNQNFDESLLALSIGDFFNPVNINPDRGVRLDEQTNPNDSYKASNRLLAYYGALKFYLGSKINVVAGVRVEDNVQEINSADFEGEINNKFPIVSVLPSINATYNINDKMLIRVAYGMTVNRPEFRELAPFSFYDFNFNFNYLGYPLLDIAKIQNFDLRWEYYPSPSELISVAAFYKNFNKPIEAMNQPGPGSGGAKNFDFRNADGAYNYGVEVEVRKSLIGVINGSFFDNLSVVFNASLLKSEVDLGAEGESRGQLANRPLQGQANYIINTGLFYNNEKAGFQVNTLYNVVGKYILYVGFDGYPDIYVMPRHVIDLSVSKTLGKKFTLKAGVSDILNQKNVYLQDANQDKKFNRNNDQIIQKFSPGQVFSLGVSYRIL
jgi:hypothetical protein